MAKAEIDEKKAGLIILAVMIASLAGIAAYGVGGEWQLVPLAAFSVSISAAVVLFGGWFEEEK